METSKLEKQKSRPEGVYLYADGKLAYVGDWVNYTAMMRYYLVRGKEWGGDYNEVNLKMLIKKLREETGGEISLRWLMKEGIVTERSLREEGLDSYIVESEYKGSKEEVESLRGEVMRLTEEKTEMERELREKRKELKEKEEELREVKPKAKITNYLKQKVKDLTMELEEKVKEVETYKFLYEKEEEKEEGSKEGYEMLLCELERSRDIIEKCKEEIGLLEEEDILEKIIKTKIELENLKEFKRKFTKKKAVIDIKELERLRCEGKSLREIATALGVGVGTLYRTKCKIEEGVIGKEGEEVQLRGVESERGVNVPQVKEEEEEEIKL